MGIPYQDASSIPEINNTTLRKSGRPWYHLKESKGFSSGYASFHWLCLFILAALAAVFPEYDSSDFVLETPKDSVRGLPLGFSINPDRPSLRLPALMKESSRASGVSSSSTLSNDKRTLARDLS